MQSVRFSGSVKLTTTLLLKIRVIALDILIAGLLSACGITRTGGPGGLLSDGYISWTTDGVPFAVHDSATGGDPGKNLLDGNYKNSILYLHANLPWDTGRQFANPPSIEFLIAHCHDTGIYILSTPDTINDQSFAQVYDYAGHSNYLTDASLPGKFHLTRFDTSHGRVAGTFLFTAKEFNSSDKSDTIRVENGVIFDFPITVIKN